MRVGVIVPVRAPAPYLAEALASALAQEPAPDAVVVVGDGSEPAVSPGTDVSVVRLDGSPHGPAAARAAGLAALDCELVALLDADDAWEPGKLAAQLEALRAHPGAAVCFGRAVGVDADGRPTGERLPEAPAGLQEPDAFLDTLYERNLVPAASAVVRRDALEAVGGFDGGPALPAASDWELWLRLAAGGFGFVCEPRAVVHYRRHAGGLTSDVGRLGEAGLAIHRAHAALVAPALARRAQARDWQTVARGRVRERRYAEARQALGESAALEPLQVRERLLGTALRVPGLRAALGRRNPFG